MFKRPPDRFQMQQEPEGMHYEWTVYTKQLKQLWLKYLGHCGTSIAPQDFSTSFTYYKTCVSEEKRAKVIVHVSMSNLI